MSKIGNLVIGVGLNLKGLSKDLNRASYKLNAQGAKWKKAGRSMATSFTLPFAVVGAAGVKMALDIETSLNKIQNLVGASSAQVAQYGKDLKNVSKETGKSQAELADGLFQIESAGIKGSAAIETLTIAAKASAIGLGETKVVADALTSVINAYGAENITAAQATDQLAAAVKFGKLEASSLAPAIGQVIPIAAKLGVTFAEVGAAIAVYSKQGADAAKASIGVKAILANFLGDGSKEQVDALDQLGLSMESVRESFKTKGLAQTLNDLSNAADENGVSLGNVITNVRALSAAYAVTKNQKDYISISMGIASSAGLVSKGFKNVQKSAGFKLNKAINDLKNVAITIGELLIPYVVKLAGVLTSLAEKFNSISSPIKKFLVNFALIVAVIGPVMIAIGTVIMGIGGVAATLGIAAAKVSAFLLVFSGVGAAILAIGGLTYAISTLFDKTSKLTETERALQEVRKETAKKLKEEKDSITRLMRVIDDSTESKERQEEAYNKLVKFYPEVFEKYDDEKDALKDLIQLQDDLGSAAETRINKVVALEKIAALESSKRSAEDELKKARDNKIIKKGSYEDNLVSREDREKGGQIAKNYIANQNKALAKKDLPLIEDIPIQNDPNLTRTQNNEVRKSKRYILMMELIIKNEAAAIQQLRKDYGILSDEDQAAKKQEDINAKRAEADRRASLTKKQRYDEDLKNLKTAKDNELKGLIEGSRMYNAVVDKYNADLAVLNDDFNKESNDKAKEANRLKREALNEALRIEKERVERAERLEGTEKGLAEEVEYLNTKLEEQRDILSETKGQEERVKAINKINETLEYQEGVLGRLNKLKIENLLLSEGKEIGVDRDLSDPTNKIGGKIRKANTLPSLNLTGPNAPKLLSDDDEANKTLDERGAPENVSRTTSNASGIIDMDAYKEGVLDADKATVDLSDSINDSLISTMGLLGDSFGGILSGTVSFSEGIKNLGKGMLGVLAGVLQKVGKAIIAAGVGMLKLKETLSFGNPFAAIAAGAGLVAIAKFTQNKIKNSVPKLAKGGVLTGETMFIGGEYAGASNNPEIVTPQNIMADTFRKVLGQNGTGGSGVGILHMDTIRFGLEKDNLRVT